MVEYGKYQKLWLDTYGTISLDDWRLCRVPVPRSRWSYIPCNNGVGDEMSTLRDRVLNGELTVADIALSKPSVYQRYQSIIEKLEAIAVDENVEWEWLYVGDWTPDEIEPYPSAKDGGYSTRQTNLERNVYHYWPEQPTDSI